MFKKNVNYLENSNDLLLDTYYSIGIWGDGPGRPFDNGYLLKRQEIDHEQKTIKLFFSSNEECIIERFHDMMVDNNRVTINRADRIIWKAYDYGKPQTKENMYIYEYNILDNGDVSVVVKSNILNRNEIIKIEKQKAFVCF
ncbi:MAG: hypothetical protein LBR37_01755 [Erysipelotrichaceae bacterium]|jgi:predicted glutamine amidotransferase|nr:hypothetical protein [Erysipelotrichaceae bacterium]